jgi:hypothetical protein
MDIKGGEKTLSLGKGITLVQNVQWKYKSQESRPTL